MRFQGQLGSRHTLAQLALLILASGEVLAQADPGSPAESPAATSAPVEVMVTVRKKEESLQEVPLSVSVISEEEIQRQGDQQPR